MNFKFNIYNASLILNATISFSIAGYLKIKNKSSHIFVTVLGGKGWRCRHKRADWCSEEAFNTQKQAYKVMTGQGRQTCRHMDTGKTLISLNRSTDKWLGRILAEVNTCMWAGRGAQALAKEKKMSKYSWRQEKVQGHLVDGLRMAGRKSWVEGRNMAWGKWAGTEDRGWGALWSRLWQLNGSCTKMTFLAKDWKDQRVHLSCCI